jgi:DNA-directed RNA polymerase specialized sigma24 family protein
VIVELEGCTDAELLARTGRDVDAFAVFYRRHVEWVLRVAARRTGSPEHAGDLTAEVFAAAMLAAGRFQARGASGEANNWLFGILLNKLAGFERRGAVERRGRRRLGLQAPVLPVDEFADVLADGGADPSVVTLLNSLPEDQRAAVRARVIDERPYGEVAAVLQISEANARKRVSRGLAALRAGLERKTS